MATSDQAQITKAFSARPDLLKQISDAIKTTPHQTPLFASISTYILDLQSTSTATTSTHANGADLSSQPTKKRKIDGETLPTRGATAVAVWDLRTKAENEIRDVSFTFPMRKKVEKVEFVAGKGGGLRAVNGEEVLAGCGWGDIDQIFCLPVPEKPKKQWHFVLIPHSNNGLQPTTPDTPAPPDQWLWTFSEPSKREVDAGMPSTPAPLITLLNTYLGFYKKAVVQPSKQAFQSTIPQSQHKGEPGFHVKAFRGSKEGFLYFTDVGIVFGFKKPVLYFSFRDISAVSYTSILQRTFNLVVGTVGDGKEGEEFEFSMIDQADYAGIDGYVKGNGLNDASLAEQRRGVVYGVNKTEEEEGKVEEGGESELQKAEMLLQDQEDEEEEDYDPGSEGESEGSGTSSEEEEEEEYGEGEGEEEEEEEDEEGDESLVRRELGSDAEDVEED